MDETPAAGSSFAAPPPWDAEDSAPARPPRAPADVRTRQVLTDDVMARLERELVPRQPRVDPSLRAAATQPFSTASLPAVPDQALFLDRAEAVERSRQLFEADRLGEGMAILTWTALRFPDDPLLARWLARGEHRLMEQHCPGVTLRTIPVLRPNPLELLDRTTGTQRALVVSIDGRRSFAELRAALPGLTVPTFWQDVGKMNDRGWLLLP